MPSRGGCRVARNCLFSSAPSDTADTDFATPISDDLERSKNDLLNYCQNPDADNIIAQGKIREVEQLGEQFGIGQGSSFSGLLNGEWELVYAPEDKTRSSPFFWAFRKAFPDQSDQIFGITDAIPDPLKVVGPAFQSIEISGSSLVSRVKVATLGGAATSIMTTRATISTENVDVDELKVKVDTTKPEESTVLKKLGPFGEAIASSAPPFPSGEALERVAPGSSTVLMKTTFCDGSMRISCYNNNSDKKFVWKRTGFRGSSDI